MTSEMERMRPEVHDYLTSNLRTLHNAVHLTLIIRVYVFSVVSPAHLVNILLASLPSPLVLGFLKIMHVTPFLK